MAVVSWWTGMNSKVSRFAVRNKYWLALAVVAALASIGAVVVYWRHKVIQERAAWVLLAKCVHEDATGDKEAVGIEVCRAAHRKYAATKAAPYFLGTLLGMETALDKEPTLLNESMAELAQEVPSQSPLFYLYRTKIALMKFDQGTPQDALSDLELLIDDPRNGYRDYAAYYRGLYYWVQGDVAKAREAWQELVAGVGEHDMIVSQDLRMLSPWALQAEQKLKCGECIVPAGQEGAL